MQLMKQAAPMAEKQWIVEQTAKLATHLSSCCRIVRSAIRSIRASF